MFASAYFRGHHYCTISTVSSVMRNSQKKSPCFKSLELKRKFIGYLGQQIFRIRELTVEMVQYMYGAHQRKRQRKYCAFWQFLGGYNALKLPKSVITSLSFS